MITPMARPRRPGGTIEERMAKEAVVISAVVITSYSIHYTKLYENLKAVAVDMSHSYVKAITENLGHVDIVFDRYHISALMNRGIDELRKEIQAKLDKNDQQYFKGARFLFLKNYSNLV